MRSLRRFVALTGVMGALLVGLGLTTSVPAIAADPPRVDIYLPPPPPAYVPPNDWTGPYIGVRGGYSWGRFDITTQHHEWELPFRGFDFGVGFGVNYQPPGSRVVIGADIDIMRSWQRGEHVKEWGCGCYTYTLTTDWGPTWVGTGAVRLGFLLTDRVMVYGRVGIAGGIASFHAALDVSNGQNTWNVWDATATVAGFGWTWGVGIEAMLGDRVSAFAEFRRVNLNHASLGNGALTSTQNMFLVGLNIQLGN